MVTVDRIDWDDWSINHIARHGVTQDDVEAVFHGDPMEYKQSYKDRLVVLGAASDGRILAVVIGTVPKAPPGTYYVFTARPADRKERRHYAEQKGALES